MRADPAAPRFPFIIDGVHVLPVLHERLEYADLARAAVERLEPDAIAVEIPSALRSVWIRAIDRLPAISVLLYENAQDQTIYLPVHPTDPLVEAARMARERGLRLECADLDVDGYADYRDAAPDSYALWRLGPAQLYRSFRQLQRPADPNDDAREASMAYHARRLREEGAERVLLLCGMHHAAAVAHQLGFEQATPLTPPQRRNIRLVHLAPESLGEVLPEIPFYVAAYEARRRALPAQPAEAEPRPAARSHGPFRVLSGGRKGNTAEARDAVARAARSAGSAFVAGPAADSASLPGPADRLKLQWALLREAESALTATAPDETVQRWQRRNLARFTRNLALSSGLLVADLYDLLSAARACVSENFAWELHRLATAYPSQPGAAADLPTARIRADELYDGTRRIRLQRRVRSPKRPDWRSVFKRRRGEERWHGEWLEGFDGEAICSYPPEDLVIEEFGRYLKQRGKRVLSEERARTVPFTTSVLDGIDVRETIRHWTEHRIFVRELGRVRGGVGSVLVIFDENENDYSYCQTWLGEHDQESDMAFYSTEPAQAIVGPGICRVTYGGMLLSYPPRRMADVWTDVDYRLAETKAETLLLAALDYTVERIVVHVAARPPRGVLSQLAQRLGLQILHLPIGTVSPTTLKKIRVMHIISGHEKRKIAKDYIW
jgi:hypothetical protein